jgi:hypothetical protein
VDVYLEGFQLETGFVRHIVQGDGSEIRQAGLWADRCIFRDFDGDFVALVLVRECFDVGQWSGNTAFCMPLVVAEFCGFRFSPSFVVRCFFVDPLPLTPHPLLFRSSRLPRLVSSIPLGQFSLIECRG